MNAPALIIVAANEPCTVKAFEVRENPQYGPVPRLAEVMKVDPAKIRERNAAPRTYRSRWDSLFGSSKLNFWAGSPAPVDNHGVSVETASQIETLLQHYHPENWGLAAPEELTDDILDRLTPRVKMNLAQVVSRDLGDLDAATIMEQFVETEHAVSSCQPAI